MFLAVVTSALMRTPYRHTALDLACSLVALLCDATNAEAKDSDIKLTEAARENRFQLDFDGKAFSGPALDQLLATARDAQFFLRGEEHGIA